MSTSTDINDSISDVRWQHAIKAFLGAMPECRVEMEWYGDIEYFADGELVATCGNKIAFTVAKPDMSAAVRLVVFPDHTNGWLLYEGTDEIARHGLLPADRISVPDAA